ncbi:MAG: hypothetical protein Fues2KO_18380 [Fuerstiella sp.]
MIHCRLILPLLTVTAFLLNTDPKTTAADDPIERFLTDDFCAGMLIRPESIMDSRLATNVIDAVGQEQVDRTLQVVHKEVGIDISSIETAAILIDLRTMYQMAGIKVEEEAESDGGGSELSAAQVTNQMKQIMLAMHNYHDVYGKFPDNDGDGKKNLSWRVHLLPFMNEARLYEQFRLDEPWDSDHNKALIDEMPDVFRSMGVEKDGLTSIHGLAGERTILSGDGAIGLRNITDGSSNTIAIVHAAKDKAAEWTKPGALKLEDGPPAKTLGDVGASFLVGFADGRVDSMKADMTAETFQTLAGYSDNQAIQPQEHSMASANPTLPLPSLVVRSSKPIDRQAVLQKIVSQGEAKQITMDGATVHAFGDYGVAFPDEYTLLAARKPVLRKMLSSQEASGDLGTQFAETKANLMIGLDLQKAEKFRSSFAQQIPIAAMVEQINFASVEMDLSGKSDNLLSVILQNSNNDMTAGLAALIMGGLEMQKAQLARVQVNDMGDVPPIVLVKMSELMQSAKLQSDGNRVVLQIPRPEEYDQFVDDLKPALEVLASEIQTAQQRAVRAKRTNNLRQIGLAFHNYHDAHRRFPRYDGDANPQKENARRGLSWRVHLLPMLEHSDLYQQFNLDEPWDSEHNRKLIAKMPDVFRTEGVEKEGHTSIHVFIGEDTLFGDGSEAPAIRNCTDGTSNTLLAVEAGPDTAEAWTKPGGLKFEGENGIKLLGKIGESFLGLRVDGSVNLIPADINPETLDLLIQPADGQVVDF